MRKQYFRKISIVMHHVLHDVLRYFFTINYSGQTFEYRLSLVCSRGLLYIIYSLHYKVGVVIV